MFLVILNTFFVPDGINSVGDYSSRWVGVVVIVFRLMCVPTFFVADGINSVGDYNSPPGGCRRRVFVSPPFFHGRTPRFSAQKGRKPNCDGR